MKRLLTLLTALLMLCAALPALAWEVSPEIESLAAAHFPGHGVLDGFMAGDRTALLLTTPAGETRLAFCTEDSAAMTQPLPETLFQIDDAQLLTDTAMLLVEDYAGTVYFVGCVRAEEGWVAKVSTPLPEGTELLPRDMYLPENEARLRWTATLPGIGGMRQEQRTVSICAEGWIWRVCMLETPESYIVFKQSFVRDDVHCVHGSMEFALDVTEAEWTLLPTTVEAAAERMDVTRCAILAEEAWLCGFPSEEAEPIARCNPGMPLMILAYEGDWAHVLLAGAPVGGWMKTDAMLIGSHQMEAEYLAPDDCPAINLLKNQLDVYLLPLDDLTTSPLLHHHDNHRPYVVYELAVWPEAGWTMIYDPDTPGGVGYVHTEQLHAEPEGPLG